jgi:hypothetical protein
MFENYTLKLVKSGRALFSSDKSGLRPLAECINKMKGRVHGCVLYDKVIGLAAAKLIVHSGIVSEVRTKTASNLALEYLSSKGIAVECESVAEHIMNKERTAICPMEEKAMKMEDAQFVNDVLKRYAISATGRSS